MARKALGACARRTQELSPVGHDATSSSALEALRCCCERRANSGRDDGGDGRCDDGGRGRGGRGADRGGDDGRDGGRGRDGRGGLSDGGGLSGDDGRRGVPCSTCE